jgi:hypothetical protein
MLIRLCKVVSDGDKDTDAEEDVNAAVASSLYSFGWRRCGGWRRSRIPHAGMLLLLLLSVAAHTADNGHQAPSLTPAGKPASGHLIYHDW